MIHSFAHSALSSDRRYFLIILHHYTLISCFYLLSLSFVINPKKELKMAVHRFQMASNKKSAIVSVQGETEWMIERAFG